MINIGIIGVGLMGLEHCRGFERLSNCKIVALADPKEEQLELAQKVLKKSTPFLFTKYEDVLKIPEINAVIVATPTKLHTQITLDALKAKKDVFLEKPIARSIQEIDHIIEVGANSEQIIQVGLVYRYSNLYRTMAHLIENKTFGRVMMAYCKEYRDNFPTHWFFDEEQSGGAILEKNVHHFDLFNWFIRSSPKKVFAMGGQHTLKSGHKIQCSYSPNKGILIKDPTIVDHANVLIEYENGAKGNLGLCMYEIYPIEGLEIGLIGDNGAWALAKENLKLIIAGGPVGGKKKVKIDYYSDNERVGHIGCQLERREFLKCVQTRKQPYANLLVARDACVISLAAEKSIKEERIVFISEFYNEKIQKYFQKLGHAVETLTPPTFSLDKRILNKKLKRELKIKERKCAQKLANIAAEIRNLDV